MRLIVGLANPGRRYHGTRHNVGADVVARVARRAGILLDEEDGFSIAGRGDIGGVRVLLARPQTYVNVSGEALRDLRRRHRVRPADIYVVVDDLDLPLGQVRIRAKGSAGGHNGLRSIIDALGTTEFPRLRIGIGRPPEGTDPAEYVLTRFSTAEQSALDAALDRAAEALETAVVQGVDVAMNRFNAPVRL